MSNASDEAILALLEKLERLEDNQESFINKFKKLDENTDAIIKIQRAFLEIDKVKSKNVLIYYRTGTLSQKKCKNGYKTSKNW